MQNGSNQQNFPTNSLGSNSGNESGNPLHFVDVKNKTDFNCEPQFAEKSRVLQWVTEKVWWDKCSLQEFLSFKQSRGVAQLG